MGNNNNNGSKIIKYENQKLYRVRYFTENDKPSFSFPLWFLDNIEHIEWVIEYREYQNEELKLDIKSLNLLVDIYEIVIPLDLLQFNHIQYNKIEDYIIGIKPEYKRKINNKKIINNHILANYLYKNNIYFNINGWYEKGNITEYSNISNINEIMLLPSAKDMVKYIDTCHAFDLIKDIY